MGATVWKRSAEGNAQTFTVGIDPNAITRKAPRSTQKRPLKTDSQPGTSSSHQAAAPGQPARPQSSGNGPNEPSIATSQLSQRHRGPPAHRAPHKPGAGSHRGPGPRAAARQQPESSSTQPEQPPAKRHKKDQQPKDEQEAKPAASDPEAKAKLEAEIAALRQQLSQRQREVQQQQQAVEAARRARQQQQRQQQEALQQKRQHISRGFKAAFEQVAEVGEARQQQQQGEQQARQVASEQDVRRVMDSRTDYDVLQVSAGCGRAAVKERYKELARLLHPDKCKVEQATEAFQKVARAYHNLSAMMA